MISNVVPVYRNGDEIGDDGETTPDADGLGIFFIVFW